MMSSNSIRNKKHTKRRLRISVVIPTKSRSQLLLGALRSLKNQTVLPFEIIIVASGGDAYVKSVKKRFPSLPIKTLATKFDSYTRTRNLGVSHAQGDVIALIDDDCLADKHWIENISLSHTGASVVVQGTPHLNANPKNIYSVVHNMRNREGILTNLARSTSSLSIRGISYPTIYIMDNKNVSYPASLRKKFPEMYATWLPDYICCDDSELASRLITSNIPIIYNERIVVRHHGRKDITSLIQRNFEYGKNDWWLHIVQQRLIHKLPLTYLEKIRLTSMQKLSRSLLSMRILYQICLAFMQEVQLPVLVRMYGIVVYFAMKFVRMSGRWYEKARYHITYHSRQ